MDLLLEAYLTGRQEGLARIFGEEAWGRVLALSSSTGTWQKKSIGRALRD
jgi:hypothetical protein